MIRDQFKDVKKVTTKENRKKLSMGEKNYYAKQISKLQDLSKSLGVSMVITTTILGIAFVMVLLLFIVTRGEEKAYETWKFVLWTCAFSVCLIFTLVWYIFIKPANLKKIEEYRHELEKINAKTLLKAKGIYDLYGEEFKKQQQKQHDEEKKKAEREAAEKQDTSQKEEKQIESDTKTE